MGDFSSATLSPARHLHFERHLESCPECAAFLRTYKKTIEAMRHDLGSHSWSTPILKLRKPPHDRYDVKLTEELLS